MSKQPKHLAADFLSALPAYSPTHLQFEKAVSELEKLIRGPDERVAVDHNRRTLDSVATAWLQYQRGDLNREEFEGTLHELDYQVQWPPCGS